MIIGSIVIGSTAVLMITGKNEDNGNIITSALSFIT